MKRLLKLGVLISVTCAPGALWGQPSRPVSRIAVTTYHYDNFRTGWNSHESVLNPTLNPPGPLVQVFQLLRRVRVDDVVYAQPLIVPEVLIAGGSNPGKHDVVYVVTENNTIYAIDAYSGTILLTRNLGPAVPRPGGCANNGSVVGIESTPVIDLAHGAMYLIAYSMRRGQPTYLLHAVDITNLADQMPPRVVSASHRLVDGGNWTFDAAAQRQRPALLLEDGNIYAAFGSFCDQRPARGWLLGWRASDLSPLAANSLTNVTGADSDLSSIWMSGYGVAAVAGHLYYATGNSMAHSYDVHNNPSETVIKVAADLTTTLDFFTPLNAGVLDGDLNPPWSGDLDFGSGGVLLLPDQPGGTPHMAVAAGKEGWMYLLDREHMGRFNRGTDEVLGKYPIGGCLCGQSYFLNNIVSSGGTQIGVWQVYTAPSPGLTAIASTNLDQWMANGSSDDGFFTAVSSEGSANAIIWAVSRQNSHDSSALVSVGGVTPPTLFAFQLIPGNPELKLLFQSVAGNWDVPHTSNDGANSNIVPVVANGHVYVASYGELDIFGFGPPVNKLPSIAAMTRRLESPTVDALKATSGIITKVQGARFLVKTDAAVEVRVDGEQALKRGLSPALVVGQSVAVYGSTDAQGVLHAEVVKPVRIRRKP
jgi:hypothetical protein